MRSSCALVFAVLSLSSVACRETRYPTPWLRTTVAPRGATIEAESGGTYGSSITERLYKGHWVVVADGYAEAMSTRNGACAVYRDEHGYVLTNERGEARPLQCNGQVREAPEHGALDCVGLDMGRTTDDPTRILWRRFDRRTQVVVDASITLDKQKLPPGANFDFIGATPNENPVVVLHWASSDDNGVTRAACTLYELTPSGLDQIESISTYDWQACGFAAYWQNRGVDLRFNNAPESY